MCFYPEILITNLPIIKYCILWLKKLYFAGISLIISLYNHKLKGGCEQILFSNYGNLLSIL